MRFRDRESVRHVMPHQVQGWRADENFAGVWEGRYTPLRVGDHTYRTYLWADLKQDPESAATCTTESRLVREFVNKKQQSLDENLEAYDNVSLDTPTNLPNGCILEKWVAAVIMLRSSDLNVSGATVARKPPIE